MNSEYTSRLISFMPTQQELATFAEKPQIEVILNAFNRMTTWFGLLHDIRRQQQTLALLAAAHSKIIEIWVLVPLGLFHSSYTALRTVVDICTSYTYYCSHPVEWTAVCAACEDRAGWESRADTVDWHIHFTPTFREVNRAFGLAESLNRGYQELSAYVHGIPVSGLPTLREIQRMDITDEDLDKFAELAQKTDADLNLLFLSVFHQDLAALSTTDYRLITRGIDRQKLATAGIVLSRA